MKKYEVFVSSTYADLIKERKIVRKALLDIGCIPACMELFPATDQSQFDYIKRIMDECDYYVLIAGGHVGSISPDTKKSYTEMEYEYAQEIGLPIISFVKVDKYGAPLELETDIEKSEQYREFIEKVQNGRIRKGFCKRYELFGYVQSALREEMKRHSRPGWIREITTTYQSDESLLLRGRLLHSFLIGEEIYDQHDKYDTISKFEDNMPNMSIKYGIDTQGMFKLIFFRGDIAINLFYDVPNDYFDEETDRIKPGYKMQIVLAKLGNIDEILMFFGIGDLLCDMTVNIYRMSKVEIKKIARISGQAFMTIDYTLDAPYGSQDLFESYVYCNGHIHLLGDLCENEEIN